LAVEVQAAIPVLEKSIQRICLTIPSVEKPIQLALPPLRK